MSQHYTNRSRENDRHSLPDVEVFYMERGAFWRNQKSGEVTDPINIPRKERYSEVWKPCVAGWWWWYCTPGCLPESDARGPFKTEQGAVNNMRRDQD